MIKIFFALGITALTLAGLHACNSISTEAQPAEGMPAAENDSSVQMTDAQIKNGNIVIGSFEDKNISSLLRVNGKIDVPPQNMVSISSPLGGYLKSTHLLPGMHVNKGEAIAEMEDQQFIQLQQDYLLAKSKLHFAQLDLNRQKTLNQSQASSDKVMQQAQAEVNNQTILMNGLAEKLRMININPAKVSTGGISKKANIYSPINGFVSKINVNIGKYVSPSEVLFELVNPQDIHLNLKVFERDVRKLYVGQKLQAYSNADPEKKYLCEILLISKDISPEGTNDVHCHFIKYDPQLLPGMYMNAEIKMDNRTLGALPEDAVVGFGGKQYIFVETAKNRFEMKEVNTGTAETGYVSIYNAGAFAGKKIVTNGAYALLMKMKNKEE